MGLCGREVGFEMLGLCRGWMEGVSDLRVLYIDRDTQTRVCLLSPGDIVYWSGSWR
jgi:hypothetical protein